MEGNSCLAHLVKSSSSSLASFLTILISLVALGSFLVFMSYQIYTEFQQLILLVKKLSGKLITRYPQIEDQLGFRNI